MTGEQAEAEMRTWSRRIVEAYARQAQWLMDEGLHAAYAAQIGRPLLTAIALGAPVSTWASYVNPVFDEIEKGGLQRGPRLASVSYSSGTVTMTGES